MTTHDESCQECKQRVFEFLEKIYGAENVFANHTLQLPTQVEDLSTNDLSASLEKIYTTLQDHNTTFVGAQKQPDVDYYVQGQFILEFDESAHFTKPRLLALEKYSDRLFLSFDRNKWMELAQNINKKDDDPLVKDEQRAWYDTLRDYAPVFLGLNPTVRVCASDYIWCSLDVDKKEDVNVFKMLINQ